jgi:hypothetical protein
MVQFFCFEVVFYVILDVSHHFFSLITSKFKFQRPHRVLSASLSLRIRGKMVQFLCFEVVFCVVLDVSHHLIFINNLIILNSNELNAFYQHLFL